ncbi:POK18 protein, partial [Galbula dea]|nr:POK18 protein [Galbula dea]
PWKFLGWKISQINIAPQQIKIDRSITILNDLQKLLRMISWIRPVLGISMDDLKPLF